MFSSSHRLYSIFYKKYLALEFADRRSTIRRVGCARFLEMSSETRSFPDFNVSRLIEPPRSRVVSCYNAIERNLHRATRRYSADERESETLREALLDPISAIGSVDLFRGTSLPYNSVPSHLSHSARLSPKTPTARGIFDNGVLHLPNKSIFVAGSKANRSLSSFILTRRTSNAER